MKNLIHTLSIFLFTTLTLMAQNGQQTVKGTIIDKQSELPLIGATIQLVSNIDPSGTMTDIDGRFSMPDIPIGRQAFVVSYLGYENVTIPNVEVTSGKAVSLEIKMEESLVKLEEVVIKASAVKDKSINDMATVSARQFSMEEVNRFSGGRSDVARLAGNFAGVSTADDSRNDIVIRGNSPTGLLWRLEGIPIPSPNHFSTVGTTGGPVSALNTNLLKSSDFLTSAFPSEYGNALSGVFDLGFRNGNSDEMEYTFQVGAITGFEGVVEGPMNKKNNGSFLVAARYSFVGIAQSMGLDIGTNAVPNYSDISFKLNSGNTKLGRFTLFGIGGVSDIEFLADEVDETDLFSADDEDAAADSYFGVLGLKHNLILSNESYIKSVVAVSGNGVEFSRLRYYNIDQPNEVSSPFVEGNDNLGRISLSSYYNRKYSKYFTLRVGFLAERLTADLSFESAELANDYNNDGIFDLDEIYRFKESTYSMEPFAQFQFKLSPKLTLNAGVHQLHYSLNSQSVIEPRAALSYKLHPKHTFNLGYGLHHQTQPIPIQIATFFPEADTRRNPNRDLKFSESHQFVLGHDFKINNNWRSKIEVYYQDISNVPVDRTASSFSVLNVGADFGFPIDKNNLTNGGTGTNKGIEITLEKFFNKGYYMLLTSSIFDSKYKGSDGIERNTAFNNQNVLNVLVGKEIKWGKAKQHRVSLDTKLTRAGGRFYTPVDLEASMINGIEMFDESNAFSLQHDSYFRWDIKVGVKLNSTKRKFAQAFYFDIQNVTDNKNIFAKRYNRLTNEVNDVFQIGFFPNFMYRIEF